MQQSQRRIKRGEEHMILSEISRAIIINRAEIEVIPDAEITPELEKARTRRRGKVVRQ